MSKEKPERIWGKTWYAWYVGDYLHREDGPAVEDNDGTKEWWINGESHREDGPAIEWGNGDIDWYLYDTLYSKEDYFIELAKIRGQEWADKIRLIYD